MKTVAFVPIRLNSQRVAGKNLRPLDGSPLMCHILKTLTEVEGIDEVYVFCSDEGIRALLPEGVRLLLRDPSLDSDTTLGREIYDSFTARVGADLYILAHATSPFIRAATLADALGKVRSGEYDSAFSAEKIQTFAWFEGRPLNYALDNIPRTQTIEPVYIETSAFFIFSRELWCGRGRRIGERPPTEQFGPGGVWGAAPPAASAIVPTWPSWTASRVWTSTTPRTSPWPKSSRRAGTYRDK